MANHVVVPPLDGIKSYNPRIMISIHFISHINIVTLSLFDLMMIHDLRSIEFVTVITVVLETH